jgi:hypothetical protein
MASRLLSGSGMKTLLLLIALITAPLGAAAQNPPVADGTPIESVEVAGLDMSALSPGLRLDITALAGKPLSRDHLNALARRIEEEHPDVVAAVRDIDRPDGRARVVFLVARIAESDDLLENINARYLVEDVDVTGISENQISSQLRADINALEGTSLNPRELGDINQRLRDEFPTHEISRRISRGGDPGQIRITFDVRRPEHTRFLHFQPSRGKLVFHERQRWSGVFDLDLGNSRGDNLASLDLVRGNTDNLLEEYSGVGFRFQNRKTGSERIGFGLELSRYTQTWRDQTRAAASVDSNLLLYRKRVSVQPTISVALNRLVHVRTGLIAVELTPVALDEETRRVTAAVAAVGLYNRSRLQRFQDQRLDADFEFHAGTAGLGSDSIYRRGLGTAHFEIETKGNKFIADFRAGRISGAAPLFERFALGDTQTLRGWDKYDITPAGADRMWHQSVEFRYEAFAYFVDAGSAWNAGEERKIRLSTGVGFHHENAFITLAFPLNADKVNATFLFGVRF